MRIITVGIDLAKNIFAVHGVNEIGTRMKHGEIRGFVAPIIPDCAALYPGLTQ